jgi:hypothetical protein
VARPFAKKETEGMRFMSLRKADRNTEAGTMPSKSLLEAMSKYMVAMGQAGALQSAEGLQSSSRGVRIKFSNGNPQLEEGPFAEMRELIVGFCIIQVKSKEEAVEWDRRWPAIDADGGVELEIRQIHEAEDFGAEFTKELREEEQKLREKIAARR